MFANAHAFTTRIKAKVLYEFWRRVFYLIISIIYSGFFLIYNNLYSKFKSNTSCQYKHRCRKAFFAALLIFFSSLFSPVLASNSAITQWARSVTSGADISRFDSVAADTSGNTYAGGYIEGTDTYDFGNGVTATGTANGHNIILVKYDSNGNAQWAKSVTSGESGSRFFSIIIDISGNIYVGGYITGIGAYDFGNGVTAAGATSAVNSILVKYDSNGNAQWAKGVISAPSSSLFRSVAVDASENIYVGGFIYGTGTYDFGNGVAVAVAANGVNTVLVKYDSNGNAQWAKSVTGSAFASNCSSVTVDTSGNIYAGGYIQGSDTYDFGNGVTVAGAADSYSSMLVKYDSNGNAQWAKSVSSSASDSSFSSVVIDVSENLYAGGYIQGSGTHGFGNGVTAAGTFGDHNLVLVKYDSNGNAQWAKSVISGANDSYFYSVDIDASGNIYTGGFINGASAYDVGNGIAVAGAADGCNSMLVKYDSNGNAQWAESVSSGASDSYFNSVVIDVSGNIYAGGDIYGTGTYGFGDGIIAAGTASGTNLLLVKYKELVSIAVTPVDPSIAKGLPQQFTAIGTYIDASTQDFTTTVTWSSSDSGKATLDENGLATTLDEGTTDITASFSGITSPTQTLTVSQEALVSIAVTPTDPSIVKGLTEQFTAIGTYTDASTQDLTTTVTWSSSDDSKATIDNNGLATTLDEGTTNITAALSGITSSAQTLTVGQETLVSIAVTPTNPSTAKGSTEQFTAIGTYTDASTQDLTTTVTWSSSDDSKATINSAGLATTLDEGTTNITAALSGITSSAQTLTVGQETLVSIAVTPTDPSIAKGLTEQFTATGTYTDTSTQDITTTVTWESSDDGKATIDSNGLATTLDEGTTNITAALSGITSPTQTLTVSQETLVSIAVTPTDPSIAKGLTKQFMATGTYTDESTQDLTATVTWDSSDDSKATINSAGFATTLDEGTTNITASLSGITSPVQTLTVGQETLVSIAVTPTNPSIAKGLTEQFMAIGTYTDTSTQDITTTVIWSSTDNGKATINSVGLATTLDEGTTNITAALSGITSSVQTLTVGSEELVSIAVTPTNPSIAKGLTEQFTAIGTYTDTSTQDLTTTVAWSSSDDSKATINSAGLATTLDEGTTNITAALSGITSSAQTLTVGSEELVSIAVTPINPSTAKGLTEQFTAIGTYTDTSTQDITTTVTWNSSDDSKATINSVGLATTLDEGTTNITAALSGITSSAQTLTVSSEELVSIAVTPTSLSIAKGLTEQFTATGTYTDT
jgi:uncharacterized protein YjdB